jgi:hypothetical protein
LSPTFKNLKSQYHIKKQRGRIDKITIDLDKEEISISAKQSNGRNSLRDDVVKSSFTTVVRAATSSPFE